MRINNENEQLVSKLALISTLCQLENKSGASSGQFRFGTVLKCWTFHWSSSVTQSRFFTLTTGFVLFQTLPPLISFPPLVLVYCSSYCLPLQGPEDLAPHPLTTGSQHISAVLPLEHMSCPLPLFLDLSSEDV